MFTLRLASLKRLDSWHYLAGRQATSVGSSWGTTMKPTFERGLAVVVVLAALTSPMINMDARAQDKKKGQETTPSGEFASVESAGEWNDQVKTQWASAMLARLERDPNFAKLFSTDKARRFMVDCYVTKLDAGIREGPAEARRFSSEAFDEIARSAGSKCVAEYRDSVIKSNAWTPEFTSLFDTACITQWGEARRAYCECLSRTVPKHFDSPLAFWSADPRNTGEKVTPEQQRHLDSVQSVCDSIK
jgi:hypothetical protein